MSVLVKGMEMPKDGAYSIVHIYSDGHVSMPFWGKGMQIVSGITAVPVPPHGDLIDREALLKPFYTHDWSGKVIRMFPTVDIRVIRDAPTVIPASEVE